MRDDEADARRHDVRGFDAAAVAEGLWLPRLVEARLIEAVRLAHRTDGPVGPKQYGSAMPAILREFQDLVGVDIATLAAEKNPVKLGATSVQMTRMEATLRWPIEYLEDWPGPRGVLAVFLRCKAYRRSFRQACERRRWPRATAYRARDKALGLIAQGLNRAGVPVEL